MVLRKLRNGHLMAPTYCFKLKLNMTQWVGALEEALYIANTDGNDVTEIATIAARGIPVFWSPDGSQYSDRGR